MPEPSHIKVSVFPQGLSPAIDEFLTKSSKLSSCLRATVMALGAFLDSLHKIADRAANTKGM